MRGALVPDIRSLVVTCSLLHREGGEYGIKNLLLSLVFLLRAWSGDGRGMCREGGSVGITKARW